MANTPVANERCVECGALISMVGVRHLCRPRGVLASVLAEPACETAKKFKADVAEGGTSYKHRDPEARRAYMRAYMKQRRAKAK